MATNPEDIKRGYLAYRQQMLDQKMDSAQYAQSDNRSALENAGRGAMAGLAHAGYDAIGTVGKLLPYVGGQNVGERLQKYAHDGNQESQYFYDPHGTAGQLGEGAGHVVGKTAEFMAASAPLGGAAVAKWAGGLPLVGGAATSAMGAALPGAAAHAAVNGLTSRPGTGDPGFWKTLAGDEGGAAVLGSLGGLVSKGAGALGRIGSRLLGGAEEAAPPIGEMPPAPPQAEVAPSAAAAPEAAPPARVQVERGADRPTLEPWEEQVIAKYRQGQGMAKAFGNAKGEAEMQAHIDEVLSKARARTSPAQGEAQAPATMSEQAPAVQESAPTTTPKTPAKTKARQSTPAEAPKETNVQADAEVSKPAVAPKKGGGKAKATPVESNSGNGAQGAPTASKSAPATKPAASTTAAPAATPEPAKVTRKNAVAERKGRIAPVAAKGGLTPAESTEEADLESYVKTARSMVEGKAEGPGKQRAMEAITKSEARLAELKAKRGAK